MGELPSAPGSRILLIGGAVYPRLGDIPGVRHNLLGMRDALFALDQDGEAVFPDGRVVAADDARTVREAVREAAFSARELLLVYVTGHGQSEPGPKGRGRRLYLLPGDASLPLEPSEVVSYAWLRDTLRTSPARRVVVILDCCYSGQAHREEEPFGRLFALLTSCGPMVNQWKGDGTGPTPFTAALIAALRAARDANRPVTVAELAQRLHDAADDHRTTAGGGAYANFWEPHLTEEAGGDQTVLSHAFHAPGRLRASLTRTLRKGRALGQRLRATLAGVRGRSSAYPLVLGTLLALALTTLGVLGQVVDEDGYPASSCPIPLQLRVLTTPEYEQPLRRALAGFQPDAAEADRIVPADDDCRRVVVEVYGAPGAAVVDAFSHSEHWADPGLSCVEGPSWRCPQLLRDVGPLPDVWLPASSLSVDRVRPATLSSASRVHLGDPVELARSPAVLATHGELPGVPREEVELAELLAALDRDPHRAAPDSSDAALLHGMAAGAAGYNDGDIAVEDDASLLCSLRPRPDEDEQPAPPPLLVAELTMLTLVSEQPLACLPEESDWQADYQAYYPSDVPALDLSFVPVHWRAADADERGRRAAVVLLRDWLTSDAGRAALSAQGFRHAAEPDRDTVTWPGEADSRTERLDSASLPVRLRTSAQFERLPLVELELPGPAEVEGYLDEAAEPSVPLDVVFVLDVSESVLGPESGRSTTEGNHATVRATLEAAVDVLDEDDRYAVLGTPGAGDGGVGSYDTLLEFDRHPAGDLREALDELAAVRGAVSLVEPGLAGIDLLTASRGSDTETVLVLVTDSGDRTDPTAGRDLALGGLDHTLVVVSVSADVCQGSGALASLTAAHTCVDLGGDQPAELAGLLRTIGGRGRG
ncbi:caspase family protein [Streptomyces profundus]|uniref:caspase family protein n=1 Tax=Streptomyces profundus TaxID=2867410 RepID=UPI001D167FF3|nr:caspase family protein [Streptomyces sp. MA3_2.13]UED84957.1 VWA domain-containing protein [Streptomyces sp. MA3_2.13]